MRNLDPFGAVAWYCLFTLAFLRCTTSAASASPTLARDADGPASVSGDAELVRANQEGVAKTTVAVQADGSLMMVRQQSVHFHKTSGDVAVDGSAEWHRGATHDGVMKSRVVVGADGSVNGQDIDDATDAVIRQKGMETQDLAHGASVEEDTAVLDTTHSADDADDDPGVVRATLPQLGEAQPVEAGSLGPSLPVLGYNLLQKTFHASKSVGGIAIGLAVGVLLFFCCISAFLRQRRHRNSSESGALLHVGDKIGRTRTTSRTCKKTMVDYDVGESVEVLSRDREWVQGRVVMVNPDGSVNVEYIGDQKLIPSDDVAFSVRCLQTQKTMNLRTSRVGDSVEVVSKGRGWVEGQVAAVQPDGGVEVHINIGKQKLIPPHELSILLRHPQGAADREDTELEVGHVVEVFSGTYDWVQARISKCHKDGSISVDCIGYDLQKTIAAGDLPRSIRRIQAEGPIVDKDIVKTILSVLERALRVDAPGVRAAKGWFVPVSQIMERQEMAGITMKQLRTVVATSETDSGQRMFDMRDGLHGAELRHQETVLLSKLEYHASGVDDDLDWELERRLGILGKGALKGHTLTRTGPGEYDLDDCVASHISIQVESGEMFVDRRGEGTEWRQTLSDFVQELEPVRQKRSRVLTDFEWTQRREAQARRGSAAPARLSVILQ